MTTTRKTTNSKKDTMTPEGKAWLKATTALDKIVKAAMAAVPPKGKRQTYDNLTEARRKWIEKHHPGVFGSKRKEQAFHTAHAWLTLHGLTKPTESIENEVRERFASAASYTRWRKGPAKTPKPRNGYLVVKGRAGDLWTEARTILIDLHERYPDAFDNVGVEIPDDEMSLPAGLISAALEYTSEEVFDNTAEWNDWARLGYAVEILRKVSQQAEEDANDLSEFIEQLEVNTIHGTEELGSDEVGGSED